MIKLYWFNGNIDSDVFINCALRKFTGERSLYIICRPKGKKPYVKNENIFFSLSHTDGFMVCAVSEHFVGADTEKNRSIKNPEKVLKRFAGKALQKDEDFFREWTAFESRKKLFGKGIFSKSIDESKSYVYTFDINGYIVSVCTEKADMVFKERLKMSIFNKTDIMLPNVENLTKWSVVACDQYTSQPEYWRCVEKFVGDAPSALKLVYPEAFLNEGEDRIKKINAEMKKYLNGNIFETYKDCLIYVERTLSGNRVRRGVVGAIDLEEYDFHKGAKSSIRATEGTVLSRIPPRVKIREDAILELPHVMLLIDDNDKNIIENISKGDKLYDFELMENGGRLAGWLLNGENADKFIENFNLFAQNAKDGLVLAVGDGNHSLATAKTVWENLKPTLSDEERKNHPSRFCLVEIENIHDDVLKFEPIHRIVYNTDEKDLTEKLIEKCGCLQNDTGGQHIVFVNNGICTDFYMNNTASPLAVGTLQKFLDEYGCEVDYIHGEDVVRKLSYSKGTVGFLLPKPDKKALFETVIKDGALPRKTFSMGEANEKRFYMEAKRI